MTTAGCSNGRSKPISPSKVRCSPECGQAAYPGALARVANDGVLRQQRRRRLGLPSTEQLPKIDFNNPTHFRATVLVGGGGLIFLAASSAFLSLPSVVLVVTVEDRHSPIGHLNDLVRYVSDQMAVMRDQNDSTLEGHERLFQGGTLEATFAGAEANVSHLDLGAHTGTHMDGPVHFLPDGEGLDAMPPALAWSPGRRCRPTPCSCMRSSKHIRRRCSSVARPLRTRSPRQKSVASR